MRDMIENIELDPPSSRLVTVSHTVMVLDRSGSMQAIRRLAVDGVNEQIQACKRAETTFKKRFTLVTFSTFVDDPALLAVDVDALSGTYLTMEDYRPDGLTALYDAVGKTIRMFEERDRGGSTFLFCVLSDGQENNSVEFDGPGLAELIQAKTGKGNWTFTYQGTGVDLSVMRSLNIPEDNIQVYRDFSDRSFATLTSDRAVGTQLYFASLSNGDMSSSDFYTSSGVEVYPNQEDGDARRPQDDTE